MSSHNIEWEVFDSPVNRNTVTEVENLLQVRFPEDFIIYAQQYHGGFPDKTEFNFTNVDGTKGLSGFDELLSFNTQRSNYIVEIYNSLSQSYFPKGIIPFGGEASGNYVCFDYRNNPAKPFIVLWQHDKHVSESVIYVADSFTDFLQMLYEPID